MKENSLRRESDFGAAGLDMIRPSDSRSHGVNRCHYAVTLTASRILSSAHASASEP